MLVQSALTVQVSLQETVVITVVVGGEVTTVVTPGAGVFVAVGGEVGAVQQYGDALSLVALMAQLSAYSGIAQYRLLSLPVTQMRSPSQSALVTQPSYPHWLGAGVGVGLGVTLGFTVGVGEAEGLTVGVGVGETSVFEQQYTWASSAVASVIQEFL